MRNTLLITMAAAATMFVVQAGPPLICHPFNIGDAKSLPWGSGSGWENPDPSYDTKHLTADTVAILDHSSSVLQRMETLRRAGIYGTQNHDAARALIARLAQRQSGSAQAFDYGYLVATVKQLEWKFKEDLTGGVDGYAIVMKALAAEPDSAEMHFAAALIASSPFRPTERDEHLRKARAATNDPLLARNVSAMFQ